MNIPHVHLAIMQPAGYVHSLGFLDQARYFRYQFRRLGAMVTISKNRLREDAVNFVFGAHLGFPSEWLRRHACIIVNLEQLGQGGASVSPEYLALLRRAAVVDYEAANVAEYANDPTEVQLVPFLHAPYLDTGEGPALESRPIDLLFFGSMNPRRQAYLDEIEANGVQVSRFDAPLYGAERDHFIRQSKAVLNCHFYDSSRFEQARVFQCLSLGTPVVSELRPGNEPPAAFQNSVFWLPQGGLQPFFSQQFGRPAFFERARRQLETFRAQDPVAAYADLLAFATGFHSTWVRTVNVQVWRPRQMNLGSGKDYKAGWLNVDVLARAEPDVVLDLGQPAAFPLLLDGCRGGRIHLEISSLERVYANNVLEHVPDLPTLMGNVLQLLQDGGEFQIEVPYEGAPTAWQDPTHLRALNENSWLYYTDWFWYLGWFEHRFELAAFQWLDARLQPCDKSHAAFMKVTLRKAPTTLRERTTARVMQADFGGLDDDLWPLEPWVEDSIDPPGAAPGVVPEPACA
ncbi:MAG: hypothetical protein Q7U73_08335 [Rubrivivax sp.]|nr:hypothetical protein [Rubrivivax sp.]